jgi:hypothetical protein
MTPRHSLHSWLAPEDIVKGTSQWNGIRVTLKFTIQNRQAKARCVWVWAFTLAQMLLPVWVIISLYCCP